MLEVSGLTRRFPGAQKPALDGVSFSAPDGDFLVVAGSNGSGKSVLMGLIAGLDAPTAGAVRSLPGRVGLVFQDADAQILGDTPEEDVAFGPKSLRLGADEVTRRVDESLARVGLSEKRQLPARSLSGGEKRRLAVAGILAIDAELIIFDEPYAGLDWPGVLQVNEILGALKADGKTVIVLTHELEKVLALADRLLVLDAGRLVFDGNPSDALESAPLADWGIRHPLVSYRGVSDLVWETR